MAPLSMGRRAIRLVAGGKSDVGRKRSNNEDRFLLADLTPSADPDPQGGEGQVLGPRGYLLLVADGMGGAAAGEVASEAATSVVYDQLLATWAPDRRSSHRLFATRMEEAVVAANRRIHELAQEDPSLHGMGSTLTAVGVLKDRLVFAQVGDSRGYLVRKGLPDQVTEDQSLLRHLMEEGRIGAEEAEAMAGSNLILQALGPSPTVEVALTTRKARRGDVLVLCTDGLFGVVTSEEIGDAVNRNHDPTGICEDLVELANSRGGPDNVTVVVGRLEGPGLRKPHRWE